MAEYIFSKELVDQMRRNPMHEVLRDLGKAGLDGHRLDFPAFKKLLGYLTEIADSRDRREPMTEVAGTHRPHPRLRVLIDAAFGDLGDLTWFRLNKIANQSRLPLKGMFTRMAASIGRMKEEDLAEIITALVSDAPDRMFLKLLNRKGGRITNAGVDLFAKIAYMFRPDLYFLMPKRWGDESGCMKFIDNDLRKYCAVCRTLRDICDEVGFPGDVRATLFNRAVEMDPVHPTLESAINNSIGAALAWTNMPEAGEAYVPGRRAGDDITMPLEVSSLAIRVRRGDMRLRNQLVRAYRGECAISGKCIKDLLEVAYIAPYPAGDVHSMRNSIPLRSDVHTLWDLNLISVDPRSMEVSISGKLRGTFYESFAGTRLAEPRDNTQIDQAALRERWSHFNTMEKNAGRLSEAAAAAATSDSAASGSGAALASASSRSRREDRPIPLEQEGGAEVNVLAGIEPKKSGSSGIWRNPAASTAAAPAPASAFGDIGYEGEDA